MCDRETVQTESEKDDGMRNENAAIRFICRNWGSFNALNQTPVMAAIKLPTIT